jgi:hypothetical protein
MSAPSAAIFALSWKTYSGDQDGSFLYLAASFPDGQKDLSVKFKQVGSW